MSDAGDVGTELARRPPTTPSSPPCCTAPCHLARALTGAEQAALAGQVVRLTQAQVEAHPAWQAFGTQAGKHPPLRLAGHPGMRRGRPSVRPAPALRQDWWRQLRPEDEERIRELAAVTGATLDARRAARRT